MLFKKCFRNDSTECYWPIVRVQRRRAYVGNRCRTDLGVAASGWLLPFSLKGAMAALATSGHGAIGRSARSEFSPRLALSYSAGFSERCRACVVGQRSTKVAGFWFNPTT